jgi:putative peptidoglycan lipid II flippase
MLQHAGLALAISVGAWLNAGLLLAGLLRGAAYQPARGWASFALKIIVAASAMGGLLVLVVPRFDWIVLQAQPGLRAALVMGVVAAAAGVYLLTLLVLGLRPSQFLRRD